MQQKAKSDPLESAPAFDLKIQRYLKIIGHMDSRYEGGGKRRTGECRMKAPGTRGEHLDVNCHRHWCLQTRLLQLLLTCTGANTSVFLNCFGATPTSKNKILGSKKKTESVLKVYE